MRSIVLLFLILVSGVCAKENSFLPVLEEKLEEIFTEYAGYVTNWFQSFNEEHLGKTEMGRFLHYDELQTKLVENKNPAENRGMKKMGTAVMPLIFHIGAASTWMLLTTLLTAKTLAVGLALLVFKIAASSAKLASFFTTLKNSKEEHHDRAPAWSPHYDHHDNHLEPEHHDIHHHYHEYKNHEFYNSDTQYTEYKTIPTQDSFSEYHSDYNNSEGYKKSVDRLG